MLGKRGRDRLFRIARANTALNATFKRHSHRFSRDYADRHDTRAKGEIQTIVFTAARDEQVTARC